MTLRSFSNEARLAIIGLCEGKDKEEVIATKEAIIDLIVEEVLRRFVVDSAEDDQAWQDDLRHTVAVYLGEVANEIFILKVEKAVLSSPILKEKPPSGDPPIQEELF